MPRCRTPLAARCAVAAMAVSALSVAASGPATEAEAESRWTVYAQSGTTVSRRFDTHTASLGITAPWSAVSRWTGGRFDGYWDAGIGARRALDPGHLRRTRSLVWLVPTLRHRLGAASQRDGLWFIDLGAGLVYFDGNYDTPDRQFGSRLNFAESIAVGHLFGPKGQYELSLRLQHASNAGIRKPNPGETFVQLRMAARF